MRLNSRRELLQQMLHLLSYYPVRGKWRRWNQGWRTAEGLRNGREAVRRKELIQVNLELSKKKIKRLK